MVEHIICSEVLYHSTDDKVPVSLCEDTSHGVFSCKRLMGKAFRDDCLVGRCQYPVLAAACKAIVEQLEEVRVDGSSFHRIVFVADGDVHVAVVGNPCPRLDFRNRGEEFLCRAECHAKAVCCPYGIEPLGKRLSGAYAESSPCICSQNDDESECKC